MLYISWVSWSHSHGLVYVASLRVPHLSRSAHYGPIHRQDKKASGYDDVKSDGSDGHSIGA